MGSIPIKYFGQKTTLVVGQICVTLSTFSLIVFYQADNAMGIIGSLVLFVLSFQCSLGPICFNHPVETCLPATIGPLNAFIWINSISTNILGPYLMSTIGASGTFMIFGSISFFFIIYSVIFVRNTSFRYNDFKVHPESTNLDQNKKQKIYLSKKEKQEIYIPIQLRN